MEAVRQQYIDKMKQFEDTQDMINKERKTLKVTTAMGHVPLPQVGCHCPRPHATAPGHMPLPRGRISCAV